MRLQLLLQFAPQVFKRPRINLRGPHHRFAQSFQLLRCQALGLGQGLGQLHELLFVDLRSPRHRLHLPGQ